MREWEGRCSVLIQNYIFNPGQSLGRAESTKSQGRGEREVWSGRNQRREGLVDFQIQISRRSFASYLLDTYYEMNNRWSGGGAQCPWSGDATFSLFFPNPPKYTSSHYLFTSARVVAHSMTMS
jgi:hypothetical protein